MCGLVYVVSKKLKLPSQRIKSSYDRPNKLMKGEPYAKSKCAEALGVLTSGYYSWLKERDNRISRKDQLRPFVLQVFKEGRGVYGTERICGILRTRGIRASFPVVSRVMEEEGLTSRHLKRKQRSLTDSSAARDDSFENLVRDLEVTGCYQVLSSDITYIPTAQGFEYQCNIIDVYTKEVLGTSQGPNMKAELVEKAIRLAVARHDLPEGLYFHTDRGSQYTSKLIRRLIKELKWLASYSRVGKPETMLGAKFLRFTEKKVVHGANFKTRDEARDKIFSYIYDFYNPTRKQKSLAISVHTNSLTALSQRL